MNNKEIATLMEGALNSTISLEELGNLLEQEYCILTDRIEDEETANNHQPCMQENLTLRSARLLIQDELKRCVSWGMRRGLKEQ